MIEISKNVYINKKHISEIVKQLTHYIVIMSNGNKYAINVDLVNELLKGE